MPAYSFKERFVPMIKDGSKTQTIRSFRKTPPRAGQLAHLYFRMRTKYCTKLVEPSPVIKEVKCIAVYKTGYVLIIDTNWIEPGLARKVLELHGVTPDGVKSKHLTKSETDQLAWADGFRHSDDPQKVEGCFKIMLAWWQQTHELPFVGNIIKW
jgi:hypothetical protein